jgi:hypothetical protein
MFNNLIKKKILSDLIWARENLQIESKHDDFNIESDLDLAINSINTKVKLSIIKNPPDGPILKLLCYFNNMLNHKYNTIIFSEFKEAIIIYLENDLNSCDVKLIVESNWKKNMLTDTHPRDAIYEILILKNYLLEKL